MTTVAEDKDLDAPHMSFGEHLEELRVRLIYSCVGVALAIGFCLFWQKELMFIVSWPHRTTMQGLGQEVSFQVLDYTDRFMIPMKVACIFGLLMGAPVVLWQMWKFIAAGLYPSERKYVAIVVPVSMLLFVAGAVFGYLALIPMTLKFLASFGVDWDIYKYDIALDKYLDLFFALTVAAGAIFEIPLVMTFLSFTGVIAPQTFSSWRKMEVMAAAILGAILTPGGDLISMASLAVPIVVLYEIGILCCRLVYRRPSSA